MWRFAFPGGADALAGEPSAPTSLAITLGDPRGIGPELGLAVAAEQLAHDSALSLTLFGPEGLTAEGLDYRPVGVWDGTQRSAGRVAARAIEAAVELALSGDVSGIVTGPIHKPALVEAGVDVPGHTELLQRLTGADQVGMLMCAERLPRPLRVLLATRHLALRDVPAALTSDLLVRQSELLFRALARDWGLASPRVALCALNPHASDEGLFGDEEARVLSPAVEALRGRGITAVGPLPADTIFARALAGDFDAVVAPYHDVGMAPFKAVSFGYGVNVTLGLPFVRTSPDHGTAFHLAGTGTADASSMIEAVRLAARLARKRFDTATARV